MKYGRIYKITNIINGKSYIGQTIRKLQYRFNEHKRLAGVKKIGLSKAIDKYGVDNFIIEEIEKCSVDNLNEREQYYIRKYDTYNNGYNLTIGGDNIFGASGDNYYLNIMTDDEKEQWLKNYRYGENNGMYNRGYLLSGSNHFLNKLSKEEREMWLLNNLRGDNNYQNHMTKDELKEKCWINKLSDNEKKEWINKNLKGDNNPYAKKVKEHPELYSGKNHPLYGRCGSNSICCKMYVITFPNGDEYITKSISQFCTDVTFISLKRPHMYNCANGKKKKYKGFKCRHYDEKKDVNIEYWNVSLNSKYEKEE